MPWLGSEEAVGYQRPSVPGCRPSPLLAISARLMYQQGRDVLDNIESDTHFFFLPAKFKGLN